MLGLYLYTLTISHNSCNMSSTCILNKLALQKELPIFVTSNLFWTKTHLHEIAPICLSTGGKCTRCADQKLSPNTNPTAPLVFRIGNRSSMAMKNATPPTIPSAKCQYSVQNGQNYGKTICPYRECFNIYYVSIIPVTFVML